MDLRRLVALTLREDHAWRDVTANLFIPKGAMAEAVIVAEERGVLAGIDAAVTAFRLRDRRLRVAALKRDGTLLRPGVGFLRVAGSLASILSAERTALNFLSHLSGVATLTAAFVKAVRGTGVHILDTRKTLPGLRSLEKAAVVAGGGTSHRTHLGEAVLVKENHLRFYREDKSGDALRRAVALAKSRGLSVQMECQSHRDVERALRAGVDALLLDNFTPGGLRREVRFVKKNISALHRPLLEASGGVHLGNVRAVAGTGVDRISIGRLTHSAPALTLSLDIL